MGWGRRVGAAILLAGLATVQAVACGAQIWTGFRPFGAPPIRVPFSWDMFSVPIERCDLRWIPPLPAGKGLGRLRDLAPLLEWDPVGDRVEEYRETGREGCFFARVPTRVLLRCVTPEGEVRDVFDCR